MSKASAYKNKFNKENYDRVTIMFPKGRKEEIKERALALNKSVNRYINDLVEEELRSEARNNGDV